eukprot:gnl/MRDRNA2_/MRDRNA2_126399_c0_seq1.p1 gnl/MRDRNA2_/MRDRNA2_126399_c0~~gnl/MRDRNA2_/MRDRNA2_126399_c0_seq1.p1  ORF type:complete len:446 (+),score=72.04 gnl/MRDRNA2_/MRDRNA2_126399_c0_seq1:158-1339(+)
MSTSLNQAGPNTGSKTKSNTHGPDVTAQTLPELPSVGSLRGSSEVDFANSVGQIQKHLYKQEQIRPPSSAAMSAFRGKLKPIKLKEEENQFQASTILTNQESSQTPGSVDVLEKQMLELWSSGGGKQLRRHSAGDIIMNSNHATTLPDLEPRHSVDESSKWAGRILPVVDTRVLERPSSPLQHIIDRPAGSRSPGTRSPREGSRRRSVQASQVHSPAGFRSPGMRSPREGSRRGSVQASGVHSPAPREFSVVPDPCQQSDTGTIHQELMDKLEGLQSKKDVATDSVHSQEMKKIAKRIGQTMDFRYMVVRNAFLALDANGDGKLSEKEVMAFCNHVQLPALLSAQFYTLMDKDEHGNADWRRFMATYGTYLKEPTTCGISSPKVHSMPFGQRW